MKALFTKIGVSVPDATGPTLDSSSVSFLFPQGFSRWEFGPDAASLESVNGAGVLAVHNASFPPTYGENYVETQGGSAYGLRSPFQDAENFVDIFAFVHGGVTTTIGGAPSPSDTSVGDIIVLGSSTGSVLQARWVMRPTASNANLEIPLAGVTTGQCVVFAAKMLGGARSIYLPGSGWIRAAAGTHTAAEGRYRSLGNTGYDASGYTAAARFAEYAHQDGSVPDSSVVSEVNAMVARVQGKGFTVYGV